MDYQYPVISVVVLLEKKSRSGSYKVYLGDQVINQYNFPVVSFKDVEGILDKFPPLAPFVLKVDKTYQDKVIEIVKGDKILTAVTVLVLSRLGLPQEEVLKIMGSQSEEFKQALLEAPIMQGVFKEWEEKAKKEGVEQGKQQGLEQGKQQGAELKEKAIAKSMLKEGLAVALIAKITGLDLEEIERLAKDEA
jgi:flagellar biosynthesis/type III secretory pathway protein FliH